MAKKAKQPELPIKAIRIVNRETIRLVCEEMARIGEDAATTTAQRLIRLGLEKKSIATRLFP